MWLKTCISRCLNHTTLYLYLHTPSTVILVAVHWLVGMGCALGVAVSGVAKFDVPVEVDGPGVGVGEAR